jgi:predicted RNA-binding protein with PUA domain
MSKKECDCNEDNSGTECLTCDRILLLSYWCETCKRPVAEKRCPGCGLKSRKVRQAINK